MARNFNANTSNFLDLVSNQGLRPPLTAFSVSALGRSTTPSVVQTIYAQIAPGFAQYITANLESSKLSFYVQGNGGAQAVAFSAGTISDSNWHHFCGVQSALNARTAYLDGTGTANATAVNAVSSLQFTNIGIASTSNPWSGDIAEVATWTAALTAAEVAALSRGVSPLLIRPDALYDYWPLLGRYSPEIELKRGEVMTVHNTVPQAAHPRVCYPRRRSSIGYGPIPVGAFTASATLPATGTLNATGTAVSVASATLDAHGDLAATGATTFTASASLDAHGTLIATGQLASVFTSAAILAATGTLHATGTVPTAPSQDPWPGPYRFRQNFRRPS